MSAEDDRTSGGDENAREEKAPEREAEAGADRGVLPAGVEEPAPGPISLDRYLSRRRPPARGGWMQIVSMVAMLGALIMIMLFKDQCGQQISQLMGVMGGSGANQSGNKGSTGGRQIEVRYKLRTSTTGKPRPGVDGSTKKAPIAPAAAGDAGKRPTEGR